MDEVTGSLNKNCKSNALFLDLAKEFDMVIHFILLEVLESNRVRGVMLDAFWRYLRGRPQQTSIGNYIIDQKWSYTAYHKAQFWDLYSLFCVRKAYCLCGWYCGNIYNDNIENCRMVLTPEEWKFRPCYHLKIVSASRYFLVKIM